MGLLQNWIHKKERLLTLQDTNRQVFPFEWGLDWISLNGCRDSGGPLQQFLCEADRRLRTSDEFFRPPPLGEWQLEDGRLRFPTPQPGQHHFNNVTEARLFEAAGSKRAVVLVPQWNADADSHVVLCRILRRLGITALRLCLPYHERRRPPAMERADFMVSPNIGRTLQTTRQAVQEVRQCVQWLKQRGYPNVGVMGTSIGSCVTYLAFVHDPAIATGVFNHVSAYFADVVWTGLSTRFVKWGLENEIELADLRRCWAPISPFYHVERLHQNWRPHRMISARYDLTFTPELSEVVFDEYRRQDLALDQVYLPCGHYTTGHFPFKYLDGWHICSYLYRQLSAD